MVIGLLFCIDPCKGLLREERLPRQALGSFSTRARHRSIGGKQAICSKIPEKDPTIVKNGVIQKIGSATAVGNRPCSAGVAEAAGVRSVSCAWRTSNGVFVARSPGYVLIAAK